jgi:DNA-binding Lrp family transcriptional regulator
MEDIISMSNKELSRLQVLNKVLERNYTQSKAGEILNLSTRQIKRLCKNLKEMGPKGLISRKRANPSNYRLKQSLKDNIVEIILKNYRDFGPTLAHEKMIEKHGIKISLTSIRNIMIEYLIWEPKKVKRKVIHQMRNRRACFGELVQIDGSYHNWFEERGSKCCLLVFIDDATSSLVEMKFVDAETTWNYFHCTQNYLKNFGRPIAFYSDQHGIFRINHKGAISGNGLTQYGRALKELDIKLICANTPQAKGRVERANRTLQDRLIKELRLQNISTIEDANRFLPTFMKDFNNRFAKVPKSSIDAHRALFGYNLNRIFTLQDTRYLSKNLTFQYKNVIYQIKTSRSSYTLRKARVKILEDISGNVYVEHHGKELEYSVYHEQEYQGEIISSKLIDEALKKTKYKPNKNHPWKRYYPRSQLVC